MLAFGFEKEVYKYNDMFTKTNLYYSDSKILISSKRSIDKIECVAYCMKTNACSMLVVSVEHIQNGGVSHVCYMYQVINNNNPNISTEIGIEIWYKKEIFNQLFFAVKNVTTNVEAGNTATQNYEVTSQEPNGCPASFTLLNKCYHSDTSQKMVQTDARDYCNGKDGSILAQLKSEEVRPCYAVATRTQFILNKKH